VWLTTLRPPLRDDTLVTIVPTFADVRNTQRLTVLKLRGARVRKKAKTRRCEGAKPFGSLPGEAAVIERMKALRTAGMGFDRVAAALNAEGIRPRRGARWHGLTINKILTGKGRAA
jgi:hypothetical protein